MDLTDPVTEPLKEVSRLISAEDIPTIDVICKDLLPMASCGTLRWLMAKFAHHGLSDMRDKATSAFLHLADVPHLIRSLPYFANFGDLQHIKFILQKLSDVPWDRSQLEYLTCVTEAAICCGSMHFKILFKYCLSRFSSSETTCDILIKSLCYASEATFLTKLLSLLREYGLGGSDEEGLLRNVLSAILLYNCDNVPIECRIDMVKIILQELNPNI